jgi:hypothetical protein
MNPGVCRISRTFLVGALIATLPIAASTPAPAMELTCTGLLVVQNGELQLKPDPHSALWCDASFDGDKVGVVKPGISERVRASLRGRRSVSGKRCGSGAWSLLLDKGQVGSYDKEGWS